MTKKSRNEIRKENYQKLINAGYSSKEATKLKSRSTKNVDNLVKEKKQEIKREHEREIYKELRQKGFTSKEANKMKKWGETRREIRLNTGVDIGPEIRGNKPIEYSEKTPKKYAEPYNYIITFTKDKSTIDYITIASPTELDRKSVMKTAQKILTEGKMSGAEKYKGVWINPKSIRLSNAYYLKENDLYGVS